MNARAIPNPQAIHNHDDVDLPFGDDWNHAAAAIHAEHAVTTRPLYVGSITAAQRGVQGSVGVELHLAANGAWLDIGPFRLPARELRRLQHLLGIVAACIGQRPATTPPAPELTPEAGRGIVGWDLARTASELSDGGLSEGEGRP
ncbi:MAG: hypothetical protein KDJ54_19525 [Candidatus Competibacteraceae bacterium]|nr:hypothetical protein [Candidatus Competibacteraceae bacterium]